MDYCIIGKGSRIRRAIVDRYNFIEPGTEIGYFPASDQQRYPVSPSGIVVVPKGERTQMRVY